MKSNSGPHLTFSLTSDSQLYGSKTTLIAVYWHFDCHAVFVEIWPVQSVLLLYVAPLHGIQTESFTKAHPDQSCKVFWGDCNKLRLQVSMISGNVVLPPCQLSGQQDSLFGNIIIFIFCVAISFQVLFPHNIFILGQRSLEPEVWLVVRDSIPYLQQNLNRRHMIFIEKYHKYRRNSKSLVMTTILN